MQSIISLLLRMDGNIPLSVAALRAEFLQKARIRPHHHLRAADIKAGSKTRGGACFWDRHGSSHLRDETNPIKIKPPPRKSITAPIAKKERHPRLVVTTGYQQDNKLCATRTDVLLSIYA